MADLSKIRLFRMTHIANMPHIVQNGITHANSPNRNPNFVPIGDGSLIVSRNSFVIPNGKTLGAYIPFYFGVRMPMLFVVQKGFNNVQATPAENIVYCVTTVAQIIHHKLDFIFTDGHAFERLSGFYDAVQVTEINQLLDFEAIKSKYWKNEDDLDLKRRKEAEFLIANDVPSTAINGYVVYNEMAKAKLLTFGIEEKRVVIKPDYYFKL